MSDKFHILMVDDQPDFLEPIAFWLETKGYKVRLAHNGKEALERIEEELPHVVSLDIQMPEMDGIETLQHIREKHPDLPVIMVTGVNDGDVFLKAKDLKISGYFPKQGSLQELEKILEPFLRLYEKNLS